MEYPVPASLLASPPASPDVAADDAVAELYLEMADLREELGAAKGELVAELRRSHDFAERIVDLRSALDQARAELAEARRPWLLRVLEALRRR